jgi:mycothiol synthase
VIQRPAPGKPEYLDRLTGAQVSVVLELVAAAADGDGVAPLSEHGMLRVQHSVPGHGRDVLITRGGAIVGYGYVEYVEPPTSDAAEHTDAEEDEASGELVIHPAHRRQGLGAALAGALVTAADDLALRVWAHGDLSAAAALARSAGFQRFRALWQLRRSLEDPLPSPAFPPGTTLRTFLVGHDEDEWLRLNRRAFAKHPEQGSWTGRDLELREAEPWFNPDDFFIAERDGAMVGFHWTKVHKTEDGGIGEVYVVGVDPDAHGGGIGRALTLAGLHHLRKRGFAQVMLYVDEDNVPAIALYQNLGFARWHTDVMYRRPAPASFP